MPRIRHNPCQPFQIHPYRSGTTLDKRTHFGQSAAPVIRSHWILKVLYKDNNTVAMYFSIFKLYFLRIMKEVSNNF